MLKSDIYSTTVGDIHNFGFESRFSFLISIQKKFWQKSSSNKHHQRFINSIMYILIKIAKNGKRL